MAISPQALLRGLVAKILPTLNQDSQSTDVALRLYSYGEGHVVSSLLSADPAVDEGSYFTVTNPTPGTALAYAITAAFANTSAGYVIFNTSDPSNPLSKSIYVRHLKQTFTVVPATATGQVLRVALDSGNRAPTGGSSVIAGPTGNPGATVPGKTVFQSIAKIWSFTGGAVITVPAPSPTNKYVALGAIDSIPVVGGERSFVFGSWDAPTSAQVCRMAPVIVPPGWYGIFHLWYPGNATTGASVEPELAWQEK